MKLSGKFHLTYCSNIFPGETWEETLGNLVRFLPSIREKVCRGEPFGVGLRLSAQAAQALDSEDQLDRFRDFLTSQNSYVFTINGFPYGAFHGTRVKENVYLPDWRDPARLEYTNRLARILSKLLPEGLDGSISTVPGAYKAAVHSESDSETIAKFLLEHAAFLLRVGEETGKMITLAIEPEPCCLMETVDETVRFFEDYLFSDIARSHIGVCFDACHMATEFEDVPAAFRTFKEAGVKISKIQISSALRLRFTSGDGRARKFLTPFAESTYLHQVVEKSEFGLKRFLDLSDALECEGNSPLRGGEADQKEWRIHFHVPIFLKNMGSFENTQDYLISVIDFLNQDPICSHLEAETYTWDVLPPEYRTVDMVTAIARELNWVRERIQ